MAERINRLPEPRGPGPRETLYPWTEWLDGNPWQGRKGEDFEIAVKSFVRSLRQAAERVGKRVRIVVVDDETVAWQAGPRHYTRQDLPGDMRPAIRQTTMHRWTGDERQKIIDGWWQGRPVPELADEIGVNVGQVHAQVQQLRAHGVEMPRRSPGGGWDGDAPAGEPPRVPPHMDTTAADTSIRATRRNWTADEDRELASMWHARIPTTEICARLGRHDRSIRQRINILRRQGWDLPKRPPGGHRD